jgi:oligopeptide/dipeptide ABC transporter ATP-binding protein
MSEVLRADDVYKSYGRHDAVRALAGVDVTVQTGRSVGIAGESGSGKSTLLRLMLHLERPTRGSLSFDGRDLATLSGSEEKAYRAAVQAVFQDPGSSFNPRHHVWRIATEPAWIAEGLRKRQRKELAARLLESVDLPSHHLSKFPHQLSGGERQRVAIARALSSNPRVVLLDEPVTSLDISVRGHVINLLKRKAREADLTYTVVSHDLTAIFHLTDHLYVMYEGIVVEEGSTETVIGDPLHPYTRSLVAAVENPLHTTDVDSTTRPPVGGCPFMHRCPHARDECRELPPLHRTAPDHVVRCVLYLGDERGPRPPAVPVGADPVADTAAIDPAPSQPAPSQREP